MKCGYVAVLGQPNAGKSSLVNCLVGEEVAVVSHRRQTTRNSILGIRTGKDYQILFLDTPGIHHSKNNLDRYMMKNVRSAIAGADVVLYLFDGSKKMEEEEIQYIDSLRQKTEKLLLVQTKADKKQEKHSVEALQISVTNGKNIDKLLDEIVGLLPEREPVFDEDMYTDKSLSFLICEKIRGLMLENIDKEIPHGTAVVVSQFEESDEVVKLDVDIICEREQHKGIIIGKGGSMLKKLGQSAREYVEQLMEKKCVIKLFVKVDKDWRDRGVEKYYY